MLKAIFNWFTGRPLPGTEAPPVQPQAAPYKVETPPVVVTATQPLPVAEPAKPEIKAKKPAAKKPAAKKPAAKPTLEVPAAPKKPRRTKQ